ncbi:hypothetical protein OsJ_03924 [Oryza sativa Japonica Group]|uniref:Amino acid transporter transmembrane domain-containing protein n=1 Tax=Oryza sativa subsp. japonica TaxID=39947 RepID=A2ZZ51_ORYSJ|nr:hypothetical protein OsJ_03924 [Oryza sativa Japonica Group]
MGRRSPARCSTCRRASSAPESCQSRRQCGCSVLLPGLLLIATVAALSDASVEFMLRYTGWDSGPPSYAGIMGDAFGRAGAKALNVCIAFTTTGTLVVYLIIIGDVLSGSAGAGDEHAGVLQELFGAQWWTARELVILVTAIVVLLPLVLRRRVGELLSNTT